MRFLLRLMGKRNQLGSQVSTNPVTPFKLLVAINSNRGIPLRMLNWLVEEKGIALPIPVFDKSQREDDGTFSRGDLQYDPTSDKRDAAWHERHCA